MPLNSLFAVNGLSTEFTGDGSCDSMVVFVLWETRCVIWVHLDSLFLCLYFEILSLQHRNSWGHYSPRCRI